MLSVFLCDVNLLQVAPTVLIKFLSGSNYEQDTTKYAITPLSMVGESVSEYSSKKGTNAGL